MLRKIRMAFAFVFLLLLSIRPAHASLINFQVTDLPNEMAGEDLWQYTYSISDHSFAADTGFTIYFGYSLYGAIDPFPSSPNADWDLITWDPDIGIPDDGAFDAYALTNNASLADPFRVSFVWLGTGTPGAQFYDIYDGLTFNVIESSSTVASQATPVPVPPTLLLFSSGLIGLIGYRKKMVSRRCEKSNP